MEFKKYRRKGYTMMRPYVPGEDLTGVSVSSADIPAAGGMVAEDTNDLTDKWYVNEKWFKDNYEED